MLCVMKNHVNMEEFLASYWLKVKESFERLGEMPIKPLNATLTNFFNKEVETIVWATTYIFKQF
jgi:hypothetical protein